MAATACPSGALAIAGDALRWFAPEDDPNVAYGFCPTCGSTLFYRSGLLDDPHHEASNAVTSICVGSIDGASGLHTTQIWFAGSAGDHVRLDDTIERFDEHPPDASTGS